MIQIYEIKAINTIIINYVISMNNYDDIVRQQNLVKYKKFMTSVDFNDISRINVFNYSDNLYDNQNSEFSHMSLTYRCLIWTSDSIYDIIELEYRFEDVKEPSDPKPISW